MNEPQPNPIRVLMLFDLPEDMLALLRAMDGRIEITGSSELEAHPALMGEAEVIFGGIDPDQLARAGRVRWVQTTGAGINQAILALARERGLTLTNASGIHAAPICEQMFGMVLMHTRRLALAWDLQKRQEWTSEPFLDALGVLAGRTLGVLGVGAIGTHMARLGAAFGMRVIGLSRGGAPRECVERMYTPGERLEFFAAADVVMNVLPLTARTRGFIGRAELAAMRPGTIVANAGRGPTIDTDALIDALHSGHVGAAMLDVTDPEPLPAGHPLWTAPNVYITPHTSGTRPDYARHAGEIFLTNMARYLRGETMTNVVDLEEGY